MDTMIESANESHCTCWYNNSLLKQEIDKNQSKITGLTSQMKEMETKITELGNQMSAELHQMTKFLLVKIKDKKQAPEPWLYFVLFTTDVQDIEDDEDESNSEYTLIYVKLIHGNQSSLDEEIESLSGMDLTVLSVNKMQLLNPKDFDDKLNHSINANIRKYDRNLLPDRILKTYSIRSFTDYKDKNSDESASVQFIKDLFISFDVGFLVN